MPSEQIASNLAQINWTVLTALAVGSYAVVVLTRLLAPATKGFFAFTAFCAAAWGFLAYLSDTGLPPISTVSPIVENPAYDAPRQAALIAFTILALITTVAIARGARATILLLAGLAAGVVVLLLGALTWGDGAVGTIPLAIQLLVLAAATGGVFAAMILGHWYLVTPKLPEAPLVLVSRRLLWVVALHEADLPGVPGPRVRDPEVRRGLGDAELMRPRPGTARPPQGRAAPGDVRVPS